MKKFRLSKPRRRSAKIPARLIPRSIARVRTDWVSALNVTDQSLAGGSDCQYLVAPFTPVTVDGVEQCFSSFSFSVMTNANLSDLYGDDVKIVAMVGDFWLRPVFQAEDACFPDQVAILQGAYSNFFIRARGGLLKQRVTSPEASAAGHGAHPLIGRDWTDAGFLKQWERNWVAKGQTLSATTFGEGQAIGVYGEVTRSAYNTPATSSGSQPLFNVPAIATTGRVLTMPNEACAEGPTITEYTGPGWKRVSIASRRTIHMHEEDALAWWVDWASLGPSSAFCGIAPGTPSLPCAMHIVPSLKVKIQYG